MTPIPSRMPGDKHSLPYIPLRVRFIVISSILLILLVGTLAYLVELLQSRAVRDQLEKRAISIAESLAATSRGALLTYNYIALEQYANQAATGPDIVYVAVHDKEGRVAGFSGRGDLQGEVLEDAVARKAVSSPRRVVQYVSLDEMRGEALEVSAPVLVPNEDTRWGTVRVALSLKSMLTQIRHTQLIIAGIGVVALLLGILFSFLAARRITRPLGALVQATVDAARGNLSQEIQVHTRDEVEVLADNFSTMIREILAQREQLEKQLMEIMHLQRYTEKLLDTMNDGLLSVGVDGRLAAINPAAGRILGVGDGLERGRPIVEQLRGIPPLMDYIEEMLRNPGSLKRQRQIHIDLEEDTQVLLANSSLLTDPHGTPVEVITNLHDITDIKKLEARMRRSERLAALGTLAAGMAHEIRNPLSAIKTLVQLLPRKIDKPGFLEKFQRTVPRELDRINRLIEDLLELSRSQRYHFSLVDVRGLLHQTLELFDEELKSLGIEEETWVAPEVPPVRADSDQLVKAFHNLIRNAMQAMPAGGELRVEASVCTSDIHGADVSPSAMDGWLTVSFRDTGQGISEEALKTIFNPFFTTKDTGTGLGLAITHKVIAEHGGHIDVKSREGEGSCFTVFLPSVAEPISE